MLLTSCVSKTEPTYVVRTVYDVPPLYFADFPGLKDSIVIPLDVDGKVVKNDEEIVNCVIPYWYLKRLMEFKLRYQETIDFYNYYKNLQQEYKKTNMENPVVDGKNNAGEQ